MSEKGKFKAPKSKDASESYQRLDKQDNMQFFRMRQTRHKI